jgi:pilus assembly protein Flp/PilA
MRDWREPLMRLITREDGATMVEYGLMVALIALAVVATVTVLGGAVNGIFESVPSPLGG